MPLYEIDCADCGEPCEVYRRNGKYCRPCALLRKLAHAARSAPAARSCRVCGSRFVPLHIRDYVCAACDTVTPAASTAEDGTCGICKQAAVLPYRGVAVCLACLKRRPAPKPERAEHESDAAYEKRVLKARVSVGRPAVVRALQHGQAKRKAANAGRERRAITLVSP